MVAEVGSSLRNHAVTNTIYAAALVQVLEGLTTVERYERRAWSRRNRALRALAERALIRPFRIHDLPLNIHPVTIRASADVTPFGAIKVPA